MARNPLMDVMSPQQSRRSPSNGGKRQSILGLLSDFRKFAQTMTPQRAEAEIAKLLGTGEMTQEQFSELKRDAEFLMQFLK